jgi:uncharacterized YkwD family protein
MTADEQLAVDLVNRDRVKAGLPALQVDLRLVEQARLKARDMIALGYFGHTSPTYGSPYNQLRKAGISYRIMGGENIALARSTANAHALFMSSAGHRQNILYAKYTHVGIGVVRSPSNMTYVVQLFAGR